MCQCSVKTVDHLLLLCKIAFNMWSVIFKMIGIHWVLPWTVIALLFGWRNWFREHSSDIWNLVPSCLMWIMWKESNKHTFENFESSQEQPQSVLIRTLSDWSRV